MILFSVIFGSIILKPQYFTNTNYYYGIVNKDSIIYGATNGGVVAYNYYTNSFRVLTNTDGLPMNRQTCIAIDSAGYLWAGSELGLSQINPDFTKIRRYPVDYLPGLRIQTIFCLKDTILVGTQSGLLVIYTEGTNDDFNDDSRIKLHMSHGLPSDNITAVDADTLIWVGTSEGLVAFSRDFQEYTQYTTTNGLLSNTINQVKVIDTTLYVATNLGLNRLRTSYFDTLLTNIMVRQIEPAGDSLLLVLDALNQVGLFFQGNLQLLKSGLPDSAKIYDIEDINGQWFCGIGNRWPTDYFGEGIGRYDFAQARWTVIKNKCLGSNHIACITANEYGVFIAHGARSPSSKGFSWLRNDDTWLNFTADSIIPTNHIHRCVTAPDKKVWFGMNAFPNNDSSVMIFSFDPGNNGEWNFIRNGYKGMDGTVAIWDIEFDPKNNMFLSLAGPSDKIWVIDSALNTVYFLGDRTPGFEVEIALDSLGKIWLTVTGREGGIIMIDTKGTLFNRDDDLCFKYGESDGLLSKYAWGAVVDNKNNLYVANESGLLIYNGTAFTGLRNISDTKLFDVELDSEERVWIMAEDGIYWYDPQTKIVDGVKFHELGVHLDFLPISDEVIQIQGFEFDPKRRSFWVGAETGLLKLKIEYDDSPMLDSVLVYPNPVIGANVVRIKNIPVDSRVSIYSISGRLIAKDLKPNLQFGEVVWQIPEDIGSGCYFVFINSSQGKKVCKFAIVNSPP